MTSSDPTPGHRDELLRDHIRSESLCSCGLLYSECAAAPYAAALRAERSARQELQQRIDAAGKMLLAIVDGLSYVDDKTDPVAIASTTLDEIKTVRAILAPTESKEPDLPLDPEPIATGYSDEVRGELIRVPYYAPMNPLYRFLPRPEFSQNPADYGIEAPHE